MFDRPQQFLLGPCLLTRNSVAAEELGFGFGFSFPFSGALDAASITGLDNLVRHVALFGGPQKT